MASRTRCKSISTPRPNGPSTRPDQLVEWHRPIVEDLGVMSVGTVDQRVLVAKGDDRRIDWGWLLVAAATETAQTAIAPDTLARATFAQSGKVVDKDDDRMPRAANDHWPVLSVSMDLGSVGSEPVERHLTIGYDDVYSIEYFGRKLRAWWRRDETMTAEKMLAAAERDYAWVMERCQEFDDQLAEAAGKTGSAEYVDLCSLAYRQAIAAHKLVAGAGRRAAVFLEGMFLERLDRHGRRDVSFGPAVSALSTQIAQGHDGADLLFQRKRQVEQAIRGPRRGDLSAGQRPDLSRATCRWKSAATC